MTFAEQPAPHWCPDVEVDFPPEPTSKSPRWTNERAEAVLEAYREHGPNFRKVGEVTGIDQRTARRVWHHWLRPIAAAHFRGLRPAKEVIAEEQAEARARLAESHGERAADVRDQLEAMREQIIEARVQTGRVLKGAKTALGDLTGSLAGLSAAVATLTTRLASCLGMADVAIRPRHDGEISTREGMKLARDSMRLLKDAATVTSILSEVERRELGDPIELGRSERRMTEEEAIADLRRTIEVLREVDLDALEPLPEDFEDR